MLAYLVLSLFAYVLWRAWLLSEQNALGPDGGYFIVRAWQVRSGSTPYRDFYWWHTPGLLYLHNTYATILGESRRALNAVIWLHHLGTLAALLTVCWVLLRPPVWGLGIAATMFLASLCSSEGFYYVMEPFISSFGWLSFALALLAAQRHHRSLATTGLSTASGMAAGMAFWTKQMGIVFLVLAAAAPTLHSGYFRPRLALLIMFNAVAIPAAFFFLHPDAVAPAYQMMFTDLATYAKSSDQYAKAAFDLSGIQRAGWMIVALLLALGRAAYWLRLPRAVAPGIARVSIACLLTGFVLLVPSLLKPYRHYLLSPLPFSAFAIACLLETRSSRHSAPIIATVLMVLAAAWPVREDFRQLLDSRSRPYFAADISAEQDVAAFIAAHAGGANRVYIAPNAPQYYYYLGRPGIDGDYLYTPNERRVRTSLRARVPAFLVNRGDADIASYEKMFRDSGYVMVARHGTVSAWKPKEPDNVSLRLDGSRDLDTVAPEQPIP